MCFELFYSFVICGCLVCKLGASLTQLCLSLVQKKKESLAVSSLQCCNNDLILLVSGFFLGGGVLYLSIDKQVFLKVTISKLIYPQLSEIIGIHEVGKIDIFPLF